MTTSVNYGTPEGVRTLNSFVTTEWGLAYNTAEVVSDAFADTVDLNSRNFIYASLAALNPERKWKGDRVNDKPQVRMITDTCDGFEKLVQIDLWDLIDDQVVKIYGNTIVQMAALAKTIKDRRVAHIMLNGQTGEFLTDEGLPIFSSAHDIYPGATQSNIVSVAGGLAAAGALDTAIQNMMGFKMNNGLSFNIVPKWLVVPYNLIQTAKAQVLTSRLASGASNYNQDIVDVIYMPTLNDDPNSSYLLGVSPMLSRKPFQFGQAKAPSVLQVTDPNSEPVRKYHMVEYHYDALCKAVLPLWATAVKINNSTYGMTTASDQITGDMNAPTA